MRNCPICRESLNAPLEVRAHPSCIRTNPDFVFPHAEVFVGDCAKNCYTLLANDLIDLTLFSPPYDGIRDYCGNPSFNMLELGNELFRVTKDGGIVAMVINDGTENFAKSLTTFRTAVDWCDKVGFRLFETVIYSRFGRPGAWWNQRFRVDHEYILFFIKGERPRFFDKEHLKVPAIHAGKKWYGTQRTTSGDLVLIEETIQSETKCRGTIWHYSTSNAEGDDLKMQHPATMPALLAEDIIKTFTIPGDTILDPMCGSGTTLVAAKKLGRVGIGFDISESYVALTKARLEMI